MISSSSMSPEEMMAVFGSLSIFGMTLVFILAVYAFIFIFYLAVYIATRIPYVKMSKRANIKNRWLIWIPIADMYVLLNLCKREFNIFNLLKTRNRTTAFWWWLGLVGGSAAICVLMYLLLFVSMILPFVMVVIVMALYMVMLIVVVAIQIFNWRVNYDLLMTYDMRDNAMLISILNCFCPLIMMVISYIIMNREPNYTEEMGVVGYTPQ